MWGPEDAGAGVGDRNREETRDSLDSKVRDCTYCRSQWERVEETESDLFFFKVSPIKRNDLYNQSKINIFSEDCSGSRQGAPFLFSIPARTPLLRPC